MIEVTRLNGTKLFLNADMVEYVESTPDTIITTSSGKHYVVREDVLTVVERIIGYQRRIHYISVADVSEAKDSVPDFVPRRPGGEEVETTSEIGNLPD
jgi:flagellar protein FlbD